MRDIAIRQYGVQSEKSFVVYPPATVVDDSALSLLPVLRDQSVRHVVYSGALGVKQDPNALFALLSAIAKARSDVRCHIFSGGPVFNRLRAAQAATDLVQFHDLVSAREIASMYEGSAVQIVTEEPGTSQGSLPSKVANILWMGVPLYCVTDSGSELAQLVEASGIGKVDSSFNLEPQVRTLSDWIDESSAWDRQASKAKVRELIGLKFSFNRILDLL